MNTLISASAGSGKTYALTTAYLRLLRDGRPPETLLAATFTRKAAGEIFDRLLSRLAAASLQEKACADLALALDDPTLTPRECQTLLHGLCAGLDRLAIGTLDGFFQRLCSVYRTEAGLSAATRLTHPQSPRCAALRRDALRAMLGRLPSEEAEAMLDDLHKAGQAASPVLETFDALVTEMGESLADVPAAAWEAFDMPPSPPMEGVDDALAYLRAMLPDQKDSRRHKAMEEDLRRFGEGRWEEFVGAGLAVKCLDDTPTYYKKPIPTEMTAHYGTLLGLARTELLGGLRRRTQALRVMHNVFTEEYITLRRAEGLMLFSEAPGFLLPLLGDLSDTARRMDASVDHLLLDEFQDTSDPQWAVLRCFARRAALSPGSVFVVGDVKQAIYGWRGGRAEIFERIELELPDIGREARDASYRSSQLILDTVNQVFASLGDCDALSERAEARSRWQAHFHSHQAQKPLPGCVELRESPADNDPIDYAAACIAECVDKFPPHVTVGVLARKNETVARLADALRAASLEVSSEGTGAIADDPAVEIILSALTLSDHPGHTASAFHVARSPLASSLGLPFDAHTRPAETAAVANVLRHRILVQGYAGILSEWAMTLAPSGTERTARRLEQLVDLASSFDALPLMRPSEFVLAVRNAAIDNPGAARVRVMTINHAKGLEFDAVFLPELDWKAQVRPSACLTQRAAVTSAAESASPIVAVYSYPNESLRRLHPGLEAAHAARHDEEVTGMLCLLYVALTRARHALHLFVRPPSSGSTPANLLRHALAKTSDALPDGGIRLYASGSEDWHGHALPAEPTAAPSSAPRPAVHFKPSDNSPRTQLGHGEPPTIADLLWLD